MAKAVFVFLAGLALVCGQALAQANSQPPPATQQSGNGVQQTPPSQPQPGSEPRGPSADQGGLTEQPNPQIVPPAGPQIGINPDAEQPRAEQPEGASQPQAIAPASNADRELSQSIEKALKNEPTLTHSQVQAGVGPDRITLSGTVPSGKDRQTAMRIAKSFAGDRKVVDKLTVVGQTEQGPAQ